MPRCIFCENTLTPTERAEHILLKCLGGRAKTQRIICSSCNEKFGSEIDNALSLEYLPHRFALKLRDGQGRLVEAQTFQSVQGDILKISPGMADTYKNRKLSFDQTAEHISFQIEAHSTDQLVESLKNIASKLKVPFDKFLRDVSDEKLTIRHSRPMLPARDAPLGSDDAQRSMIKMLLVLAARTLGNEAILQNTFDAARRAVMGNISPSATIVSLAYFEIEHQHSLIEQVGELYNSLLIFQDFDGTLYGEFKLLNGPTWVFKLGKSSLHQGLVAGIACDPTDPKRWVSDKEVLQLGSCQIGFEQYDDRCRTLESWAERVSKRKNSSKRESLIESIINRVLFDDYGLQFGDIVTDEVINAIAFNVTSELVGFPRGEETITIGEYLARSRRSISP